MNLAAQGLQPLPHEHWYLVSIYDCFDGPLLTDESLKILKGQGMQKSLSVEFSDLTDKNYKKSHEKCPEVVLFGKSQAKKIVEFVDDLQNDKTEGVLVAHCHAGISRSGAVGAFACDYCRLNYGEFIKANRYIMANQYVLNILKRVSGMTPAMFHDGIDPDNPADGEIIIPNH